MKASEPLVRKEGIAPPPSEPRGQPLLASVMIYYWMLGDRKWVGSDRGILTSVQQRRLLTPLGRTL